MERDDLLVLLKQISEGFVQGEMKPELYARTVEGLISSNLDTVPDLESFSVKLVDYGVRGAAEPMTPEDLRAIAEKLIAACSEPAG